MKIYLNSTAGASPIHPQDRAFHFERSLRESIDNEEQYEAPDLGPTDSLPADELDLEYELFFGLSPLTSSCSSPLSSPPSSRSASPKRSGISANPIPPPPPPPPVTNSPRKAQNSQSRRNKERGRQNRRRKRKVMRDDCREDPYEVRGAIAEKYLQNASPAPTPYDAGNFPVASSGYIALPDEGGGIHSLKQLVKMGFRVEAWDGRNPRPITDASSRIIAVLAGTPEDTKWEAVHRGAANAIRAAARKCKFPPKAAKHRRGNFPALSWGISHGGGQKHPGNLYHGNRNARALADLTANENISRIAGYASGAFAAWAPKLYTYYETNLEALLAHDPALRRNWPNSVWASFAVNFGPKTVCHRHRDFANLPFGWCGVTALGEFDPTKGGHLILWNLKLVMEFPPGSTILLPSATIPHSNVPIGKRENRLSFTQYSVGGLFRWVDQGFQRMSDYVARLTAEDVQRDLQLREERCKFGVNLFSTVGSLGADQTARNRLI